MNFIVQGDSLPDRQTCRVRVQNFEITTTSHSKDSTVVLHGIPYVLKDSWNITYPSVSCRYSSDEIFSCRNRRLVHQTLYVTRTKLTSPPVYTYKGRVIWNTSVPVMSPKQLTSSVHITIRSFLRNQHADKFFV
ncbi:hypothetical protein TNCV_1197131 [Trichonephila clavipes]|uniref:Uncharacterized protein n=1 Tax=Trichonephila clavipes TaxID=2585209 RepID=A0A8X6V945_TRICX|nr:hypothetical protein TNCV_1197131 [Trichonephila clavipes]